MLVASSGWNREEMLCDLSVRFDLSSGQTFGQPVRNERGTGVCCQRLRFRLARQGARHQDFKRARHKKSKGRKMKVRNRSVLQMYERVVMVVWTFAKIPVKYR